MEIIWVRHFMTPGNRKKQYIGSTDEPLDEEMIPQDLKDYPKIDALTVSPMLRCRQQKGSGRVCLLRQNR